MEINMGNFIEKFSEYNGRRITKALLSVIAMTIFCFCLHVMWMSLSPLLDFISSALNKDGLGNLKLQNLSNSIIAGILSAFVYYILYHLIIKRGAGILFRDLKEMRKGLDEDLKKGLHLLNYLDKKKKDLDQEAERFEGVLKNLEYCLERLSHSSERRDSGDNQSAG